MRLAAWALLLFLMVGSLAFAHSYTLPHPTTEDAWLKRAVFEHRLPSERGMGALRSAAEERGGRISVHSDAGGGTRVEFRFPRGSVADNDQSKVAI